MSSVSKLSADRNQRVLLDLVSKPGNDVCADCKARAPRWASYNLGIFLCVNCASIHRKIGTHVTKVKSLTMDSWTREQVEMMKSVGNIASNIKYNPDENRHPPPTNREESERDSELEKYIRAKYEFKRFVGRLNTTNLAQGSTLPSDNLLPRSRQTSFPPANLARRSSPLPSANNLSLPHNQPESQHPGTFTAQTSGYVPVLPQHPPASHVSMVQPPATSSLSSQPSHSPISTSSQRSQPPSSHPIWDDMMSLAAPRASSMTPSFSQPSPQLANPSNLFQSAASFQTFDAKASSALHPLPSIPNTMASMPSTANTAFVQQQTNMNAFQQPNPNIILDQRHFTQPLASFSEAYPSSVNYGQQTYGQQTSFYPQQGIQLTSPQVIPVFPPEMPLQSNQFGTAWQPQQPQSFHGQSHYSANPWGSM